MISNLFLFPFGNCIFLWGMKGKGLVNNSRSSHKSVGGLRTYSSISYYITCECRLRFCYRTQKHEKLKNNLQQFLITLSHIFLNETTVLRLDDAIHKYHSEQAVKNLQPVCLLGIKRNLMMLSQLTRLIVQSHDHRD